MRGLPPDACGSESVFGQVLVFEKSGQCEKSEKTEVISPTNLGCAPRNTRNYNLRREKADSDYNYKRCETVVGSHISTIIAVDALYKRV